MAEESSTFAMMVEIAVGYKGDVLVAGLILTETQPRMDDAVTVEADGRTRTGARIVRFASHPPYPKIGVILSGIAPDDLPSGTRISVQQATSQQQGNLKVGL